MKMRSNRPPRTIGFDALRSLDETGWRSALTGDPEEAARWLDAAARYGLVEAQTLFAQVLLDGRGLPRDPVRAFRWFRIAGDAGHAAGDEHDRALPGAWMGRRAGLGGRRGLVSPRRRGILRLGPVQSGQHAAARTRRTARPQAGAGLVPARGGSGPRQVDEPRRPLPGGRVGDPGNRRAAIAWYQRAAELGDFRAQFNVATWLLQGDRVADAVPWLQRAAETGSFDFLGEMDAQLQRDGRSCLEPVRARIAKRLAAARTRAPGAPSMADRSGNL